MSAHRIPQSTKAAAAMLERFAAIEGDIAHIEGVRNRLIADANANADKASEALLAERTQILEKLEPWWKTAGHALTEGKRKSIELGGCIVGSRLGKDSLAVADEKAAIAALSKRTWAKPLLKVKTTLDKSAVLKSLDGVYRKQLAALGLSRKSAEETFYVERAEQAGTMAETSS